ncbi:hypothetical protein VKT23_015367 [Stygiomarasmius scandens]|uniref:Maturase K n=1 Tax=Marasmiellus scandens TaxID=2682957 RepID=A0ABR1J0Y3_9AGAR
MGYPNESQKRLQDAEEISVWLGYPFLSSIASFDARLRSLFSSVFVRRRSELRKNDYLHPGFYQLGHKLNYCIIISSCPWNVQRPSNYAESFPHSAANQIRHFGTIGFSILQRDPYRTN